MNLNTWRMQFLTSTYFWSCRKVSISTSPRRRIVAQSWVWRVSSKTRSVQGHPEEHLPPPPTPSLVDLWGLEIAIYCEFDSACVALELIDLLTFEKILEKCIKDAHCKVSYVFLYILLMKFAQIQNSLPIWNHLWFIAICFESDSAFESGCNMWSIHNTV